MKYRVIPHTDLVPSQLCLGTNRFGTIIPKTDAFDLLDVFLDQGGSFLDTAHVYADWINGAPKSASEKTIGAWVQSRRKRDQVVLSTKGGHPPLGAMHRSRLSAAEIRQDVEESLRHLRTDVIDLYWLHRDDPARDVGDILETLNDLVKAGNIRFFGCSNWTIERILLAANYTVDYGIHGFVANQPMWSLATPKAGKGMFTDPSLQIMDQATWDYHLSTQMAVVPYSSQAKGYFSKQAEGNTAGLTADVKALFDHPVNRETMQRVIIVAKANNTGVAQIVLSYLLSQPFPVFPVIGCRTREQLETSIQATQLALPMADLVFLAGPTMHLHQARPV